MLGRLRPRTRRGRAGYALGLVTFLVLDALALMGSELALELLVTLSGMLVGAGAAYAVTRPFRNRLAVSGVWRIVGVFVGLAFVFGIIFGGSALLGVPAFPTAESGNAGALIYGLAFGFGVSVPHGLGLSGYGGRPGAGEDARGDLRLAAVVLGAVAGLFVLLFAAFLVLEYVVAPLIRYLAA